MVVNQSPKKSKTMEEVMNYLEEKTGPLGTVELVVKNTCLEQLAVHVPNYKEIARRLAFLLFIDEERISSNCRGVRGKTPLDNSRMNAIKNAIWKLCPGSENDRNATWKECIRAIDQHNRGTRRSVKNRMATLE